LASTTRTAWRFPGGLLLTSSGQAPAPPRADRSLELDAAPDTLGFDLALEISADRRVSPSGTVTIDVQLPGTWGRLGVAVLGVADRRRARRDAGERPGDHAAAAVLGLRLARLGRGDQPCCRICCQAIVDWMTDDGQDPPTGVLAAVLALAADLQIYADDGDGL
jgi:hypothetical protein